MPVSNPSYFPPNRSNGTIVGITAGVSTTGARNFLAGANAGRFTNISDLIVIGDSALDAGTTAARITNVNLAGSIAVGTNALGSLTSPTPAGGGVPYANIAVGFNAGAATVFQSATVVIGSNALKSMVTTSLVPSHSCVVIGAAAIENVTAVQGNNSAPQECVIIGAFAAQGSPAPANCGLQTSVIIGSGAAKTCGSATGVGSVISNSVIIGFQAGLTCGTGNASNNVLIGSQCAPALSAISNDNVIIGYNSTTQSSTLQRSVAVGAQTNQVGSDMTFLGYNCAGTSSAHSGWILIGARAGTTLAAVDDQFAVETTIAGVHKGILFGNLASGNLIVGNSTSGTDRDFGGVGALNILKLLNGAKGTVAPLGGGYFYVAAGALHWVGSAGTDTPIAPA